MQILKTSLRARPVLTLCLATLAVAGLGLGAMAGISPKPAQTAATPPAIPPAPPAPADLSAVARLGRALFYDPHLSGSGQMACASCHDPRNHYAPMNDRAVQLGGPHGHLSGIRAVPSLTYRMDTPIFSVGEENPGDDPGETSPMAEAAGGAAASAAVTVTTMLATGDHAAKTGNTAANPVPRGGMFWDGRADTLQAQVMGPMMSPFEMANPSRKAVYEVLKARYGATLKQLFGPNVLADQNQTLDEAAFALSRYQVEDPSFHPYSSKYDAYLAGKAKLSAAEAAGLKLFDDPNKGNCAACHLDQMNGDGTPPMFTDYEYEALGVPRNMAIPADQDPKFFDLGICGPLRGDIYAKQAANCGLFKTPSLRNVGSRHAFFHNGFYHNLSDVVRFYVERDTEPQKIYPRDKNGKILKYNDLPKAYQDNIDYIDAPFTDKPGQKPALNAAEIADIVAFLGTLTDGYSPKAP